MFEIGDAIVHPIRGAGIITDIEKRRREGERQSYYTIDLLAKPHTQLMLPVSAVDDLGIRSVVSARRLCKVWQILESDHETLPKNYRQRHKVITEQLHSGDIFKIAEVLRDLTWRRKKRGNLSTQDLRSYQEALDLLSAEVAAIEGKDWEGVKHQIWEVLEEPPAVPS